ncbi:hypothetical protein ACGFNU_32735 [Spirillospora sp. NPDC048911]|uniref:hypothetical protein n=1 Tax=Spirillospora sp. NPDC048911 TaxID=3364527 RepID=UPI003720CD83
MHLTWGRRWCRRRRSCWPSRPNEPSASTRSSDSGALDNAPYDIRLDPETHHAYQQTYVHALGADGVDDLLGKYYLAMFDSLADATGVDYEIETYTRQQTDPAFRHEFLATLYRNLVKERLAVRDHVTLSVMVKGGDWTYGCQLVDEAFAQLPGLAPPPRVFTPMVLTDTGAKLSKSLILAIEIELIDEGLHGG